MPLDIEQLVAVTHLGVVVGVHLAAGGAIGALRGGAIVTVQHWACKYLGVRDL